MMTRPELKNGAHNISELHVTPAKAGVQGNA